MKPIGAAIGLMTILVFAGCSTAYKAQPVPFKLPASYGNATEVDDVQIGGQAFVDEKAAKEAFGFDVRKAGMLPVQLVFDNRGNDAVEIIPGQTFLEDDEGDLWPILSDHFAYERATKYARTNETFEQGAYKGFLGAAAGSVIGAAIGIVSGENVGSAIGKGAAVGGAAGATLGGASAYASDNARAAIVNYLHQKTLKNKAIEAGSISHGVIFFPGEAKSAKQLRLQLRDLTTGKRYTVYLKF